MVSSWICILQLIHLHTFNPFLPLLALIKQCSRVGRWLGCNPFWLPKHRRINSASTAPMNVFNGGFCWLVWALVLVNFFALVAGLFVLRHCHTCYHSLLVPNVLKSTEGPECGTEQHFYEWLFPFLCGIEQHSLSDSSLFFMVLSNTRWVTLPLFGYSSYPSDVPFGLEYFPFSVNGASVALNCYLIPFLSSVLDGLPRDHL